MVMKLNEVHFFAEFAGIDGCFLGPAFTPNTTALIISKWVKVVSSTRLFRRPILLRYLPMYVQVRPLCF